MFKLTVLVTIAILLTRFQSGHALGCYSCESNLGSDRKCEEGSYTAPYQETCVPTEGERRPGGQAFGIFAHYCTKVVGRDLQSNQYVTMRSCTNRFRNECKNSIQINGRSIDGCIYSCNGKYCNGAPPMGKTLTLVVVAISAAIKFL